MKEEIKKLQEKAREELKRIKREWEKHRTMNKCSVCDSPNGHTTYEEFSDTLIEQTYKQGREDLIEEIEEMKKDISGHETIGQDGFLKGYNKAIEDIFNK